MTTTTRRIVDGLTALGSMGVIVVGISIIDERTRNYIVSALHGELPIQIVMPDVRVTSMIRMATDIVGRDHTEIAAFVAIGFVLFLMMFKL